MADPCERKSSSVSNSYKPTADKLWKDVTCLKKTTNCLCLRVEDVEERLDIIDEDGQVVLGYGNVLITPNTTDLSGTNAVNTFLLFPVQTIPPAAVFSWVNMNSGTLTGSPSIYGVHPITSAIGFSLNSSLGDEHIVIDKGGVWSISLSTKVTITSGESGIIDIDFGLGITIPSAGPGPTEPALDGFVTAPITDDVTPGAGSGTCVVKIPDGTRIDIYIKASSSVAGAFTGTLNVGQNGIIALSRIGA